MDGCGIARSTREPSGCKRRVREQVMSEAPKETPEPIRMLFRGGRWISEAEIELRRQKSEEAQRRAEVERAARERV
jgi:hypothetical protein